MKAVAASLWVGPFGAVSHRSAAVLVGFDWPSTDEIDVVTEVGKRGYKVDILSAETLKTLTADAMNAS